MFLHGMFGRPDNWRASMDALSPVAACHAPSLPVFHTPVGADPIGFLVQRVRAHLRAQAWERVILVGNSLGGHIAVRVALLEPERVAGLVLSGSSGLFERGLEKNVPRRPDRDWLRRKAAQVFFDERHVTEALVDEISAVVYDRTLARQLIRVGQSAKRDNLAPVLPQVTVPTLLAWGEDDTITPLDTAGQFRALLPRSELALFPRCGHAAMLEQPDQFNEVLVRFVTSTFASREVLPIAHGAQQEQSRAHAGENHQVATEIPKLPPRKTTPRSRSM